MFPSHKCKRGNHPTSGMANEGDLPDLLNINIERRDDGTMSLIPPCFFDQIPKFRMYWVFLYCLSAGSFGSGQGKMDYCNSKQVTQWYDSMVPWSIRAWDTQERCDFMIPFGCISTIPCCKAEPSNGILFAIHANGTNIWDQVLVSYKCKMYLLHLDKIPYWSVEGNSQLAWNQIQCLNLYWSCD